MYSNKADIWGCKKEEDAEAHPAFDFSELLCCPSAIARKLKEQWRASHLGGCRILSKGDECKCHLCLIDRLRELAEKAT